MLTNEQFAAVFALSAEPVAIYCGETIVYANPACAKLTGANGPDALIGSSIRGFIPPAYAAYVLKQSKRLTELKRLRGVMEMAWLRTDGSSIAVQVQASSIRYDGMPSVLVQAREIAGRERIEQANANAHGESVRFYRRILEFVPDPLVVTEGGTIAYMNMPAIRLFRLEDGESVIGKRLFDFFQEESRDDVERTIRELMDSGAASPFREWTLHCPNGEVIDIEVSSMRIDDYGGRSALLSVLRDLTARKNAEAFIVQTEKLSAIGQLAAGVAHEIRNPLTTLKGFTKLLQQEVGDRYPYLVVMEAELDRINFIVNEFMSLSKPHLTSFRLGHVDDIVRSVLQFLEAQANLGNVALRLRCEEELPPIECDENQLKQVFINIINNAMDAMPAGGNIAIDVSMNEDRLVVAIQDDGPGIDERVAARLGEPFFTTKPSGTGLGLMICKRIIDGHGGTFAIGSAIGAGTTVTITLPARGAKAR